MTTEVRNSSFLHTLVSAMVVIIVAGTIGGAISVLVSTAASNDSSIDDNTVAPPTSNAPVNSTSAPAAPPGPALTQPASTNGSPTPMPTPSPTPFSAPFPLGAFNNCGTNNKLVSFTFDDGPVTVNTRNVLAELRDLGLQGTATFFISPGGGVPHDGTEECEVVREILKDGHEIQSHTYSHSDLVNDAGVDLISELQSVEAWVRDYCGIVLPSNKDHLRIVRPPFGSMSRELREQANAAGYAVGVWNVDSYDWRGQTFAEVEQAVVDTIQARREAGQESFVLLFHDTRYFPGVLSAIKQNLFDEENQFVTASTCYKACSSEMCDSPGGYTLWN